MAEKKKIQEDLVVTVNDMLDRVQGKVDEFSEGVDEEFKKERKSQLEAKPERYFIFKNKYWDLWFQKLFAQMISVKIWIIALITVLLTTSLITSIQFASILGIIMAMKGAFQVAGVFRKNGSNGKVTEMDKT